MVHAVVEIALIFQLALVIRRLLFLILCMHWPGISKKEGSPQESSGFPLAVCGVRGASWYLTRLPAATMSCVFGSWDALMCQESWKGSCTPKSWRGAFVSIISADGFAYNSGAKLNYQLPVCIEQFFFAMYRTQPNKKMPAAL